MVLTEPVVAALRDAVPAVEIGFAVKEKYLALVAAHPCVTTLHALGDGPGAMSDLARDIRAADYSAVVDLHKSARTASIVRSSGIPIRTAYRKREFSDAVRVRFLRRPFRARRLLVRRYLDALEPLGIRAPYREPRLYVSDADAERAGALLDRLGLPPSGYAVVVPGSVWPTKRWPRERFREVAGRVASDLGLPVLLLGTPAERELCDDVLAGASGANLSGETTLGEAAALTARARLFVGNDSGPTHMAKALGVPSVSIFGPTDPGQFCFDGHELLYRDLSCSACSFYGGKACPLKHWDCMTGIGADDVIDAAARLLADAPRGGER